MKSFIALSCLLVVASASANSYYYNSRFPQYQQQYGYKAAAPVAAPQQQAYQPIAPVAAPVVKAAPVVVPDVSEFGLGSLSQLAGTDFSFSSLSGSLSTLTSLMASMDFSSLTALKSMLPNPVTSLAKASKKLDDLSRGLPSALANIDPAVKADVAKVNVIIAEVCDKMLAEATPSEFTYYSPEGIKASCDFITATANDILQGLDDPSIIQSYVDKVQKLTRSLQAQAAIYSSLFE